MLRDLLLDLASLVIVLVLPVALKAMFSWLGVKQDSNAALAINNAVERGAGFVYQSLIHKGVNPADKAAYTALMRDATDRVMQRVTKHTDRLNVSPNEVKSMIEDSFGKLLAADPGVSLPTRTHE